MQKITPFLWFDTQAEEAMRDPQKRQRAMNAMLQMRKIDIARLKEAAGEG
jgi:predicted 3-demethylubiquinone-9 3-methyltransferase (glyoxalase superfamily)